MFVGNSLRMLMHYPDCKHVTNMLDENRKEFDTVENMNKYGGSFVKALAECFHHADCINKDKLIKAFPEYWKQYAPSKWDDNLAEQADQDLKESSFTGDARLN